MKIFQTPTAAVAGRLAGQDFGSSVFNTWFYPFPTHQPLDAVIYVSCQIVKFLITKYQRTSYCDFNDTRM